MSPAKQGESRSVECSRRAGCAKPVRSHPVCGGTPDRDRRADYPGIKALPTSSAVRHILSIDEASIIRAAGDDSTYVLTWNALTVFEAVALAEGTRRDKLAEAPAPAGPTRAGAGARTARRRTGIVRADNGYVAARGNIRAAAPA